MMHGACFLACSNMSRTPRCADADEHLDEVRTRNGEERNLGFARDGAREEGLAGAGRPHHEHPARDLASELLKLGGIAKKVDELGNFLLGFVDTGNVRERHLDLVLSEQARTALAERERSPAACPSLHLAHEENPYADQQQHREPGDENLHQQRLLFGRTSIDHDPVLEQIADQRPVVGLGRIGAEPIAGLQHALNVAAFDDHLLHPARLHVGDELRVVDLLRSRTPRAEVVEDGHQHQGDDHPENQVLCHVVHCRRLQSGRCVAERRHPCGSGVPNDGNDRVMTRTELISCIVFNSGPARKSSEIRMIRPSMTL